MGKEKKEIWIEKLIELLNEYTNKQALYIRMSEPYKWVYLQYDETFTVNIISKKFWFIKWLVENDKIDQTNKFCVSVNVEWKGMGYTKAFEGYESLLMLLAIQDEPTRFLCEILK